MIADLNITWEGSISEGGAPVWRMITAFVASGWVLRLTVRDGEDTWSADCIITGFDPEYEDEGGVVVALLNANCELTREQHWVNVYNIKSIHIY